jgi:hypothetical protein
MSNNEYMQLNAVPFNCPRCGYDLGRLPCPHDCPECGFAYDDRLEVWRSRRNPVISIWVVLMCFVMPVFIFKNLIDDNESIGELWFAAGMLAPLVVMATAYLRRRMIIIGPAGVLVQGILYGWSYFKWAELDFKAGRFLEWTKNQGMTSPGSVYNRKELGAMVDAISRRIEEYSMAFHEQDDEE